MSNVSKKDRLESLILYYSEGKKSQFANKIGVTPQTISTWLSRGTFDIELVFAKCEHLSAAWLITGKGNMIEHCTKSFEYKLEDVEAESNIEIQPIAHEKITCIQEEQDVPLYDITAAAGCVSLFQDSHNQVPIDKIKIPNLAKCDGAMFTRGDSMYPILKSGDIVLYKVLPDLNYIIWGETYIVCYDVLGDLYNVIKYVQRSSRPDYLLLVSHNEHHQPFEVHISQVKAMALVRASIRYNNM